METTETSLLILNVGVCFEQMRNADAQGAKLAAEEVNKAGGVFGRPIELVIEDNQSTNPGAVLAFSKLAGDKDIPAFIGSVYSTQIHAMVPDILRLGKPVMIGATDPQLTHVGNPWLFWFRPNDIYSALVIADYGVKTLGKKKWAIVHSTDAFGTNGMKNLVEDLKGMGVEPALVQGYTNNSQDFTPVVLAVKQSGADVSKGNRSAISLDDNTVRPHDRILDKAPVIVNALRQIPYRVALPKDLVKLLVRGDGPSGPLRSQGIA